MLTWATYSLSDLLLFTPHTYFRLYELYNTALWPFGLFISVMVSALLIPTKVTVAQKRRMMQLLLSLMWMAIAWFFFYSTYAQINNFAHWFAVAFGIQSLLLAFDAISDTRADASDNSFPWNFSDPGALLFLFAVLVHPLIGLLAGRPLQGIELFGLAPDPTALGTLGFLLAGKKVTRGFLLIIPLAWCLVSGLTYLAMELPYGLITPVAALIALALRPRPASA